MSNRTHNGENKPAGESKVPNKRERIFRASGSRARERVRAREREPRFSRRFGPSKITHSSYKGFALTLEASRFSAFPAARVWSFPDAFSSWLDFGACCAWKNCVREQRKIGKRPHPAPSTTPYIPNTHTHRTHTFTPHFPKAKMCNKIETMEQQTKQQKI